MNIHHFNKLILALCLVVLLPAAEAAPRKPSAEEAVVLARDAFRAGDAAKLNKAAALAKGHVLVPWVEYWQLKLRLETASPDDVNAFLAGNTGTLLAENLRREWLKQLGKRGQWEAFQSAFPQLVNEDADTSCYSRSGRWRQQDASALAEVRRF